MYHVRCIDVVNKTKSTTGKNKWLLLMILLNQPLSVQPMFEEGCETH